MFGEIIMSICAVLAVGIIFERASKRITDQVNHLTKVVEELVKTVVKIDSTYVTEEECAERREDGRCLMKCKSE